MGIENMLEGVDDFDYGPSLHDPAEVAFTEYEQWREEDKPWSPLLSLEELALRPNLPITWYCPDFIPVGAKTILSGAPKAGKSLLMLHILKAIITGGKFLGHKCEASRVVFLTEQTEHEFKKDVSKVQGLLGNPNFYVLLAEKVPQTLKTWDDTIEFADQMMSTTDSKVLVIDTFGSWAKLPPNSENDAATIQNQINKLNTLLKNGLRSIVLLHHSKKQDPKAGKDQQLTLSSARGSSAFVGGAGHVILINAPERGCQRRDLALFGRYVNDVEKHLLLTDTGYQETNLPTFTFPKAV